MSPPIFVVTIAGTVIPGQVAQLYLKAQQDKNCHSLTAKIKSRSQLLPCLKPKPGKGLRSQSTIFLIRANA
jgi:hypothetical protein